MSKGTFKSESWWSLFMKYHSIIAWILVVVLITVSALAIYNYVNVRNTAVNKQNEINRLNMQLDSIQEQTKVIQTQLKDSEKKYKHLKTQIVKKDAELLMVKKPTDVNDAIRRLSALGFKSKWCREVKNE